jgi:hypothetical protein
MNFGDDQQLQQPGRHSDVSCDAVVAVCPLPAWVVQPLDHWFSWRMIS